MASVYMVRALAEAGHVRLQLRRNRDTRALEYVAVRRLAESPMVPIVPHTCDPRGVARRMMKLLNKAAVTCRPCPTNAELAVRSEEHTSELQSLMRISYAVFCLKKTRKDTKDHNRP